MDHMPTYIELYIPGILWTWMTYGCLMPFCPPRKLLPIGSFFSNTYSFSKLMIIMNVVNVLIILIIPSCLKFDWHRLAFTLQHSLLWDIISLKSSSLCPNKLEIVGLEQIGNKWREKLNYVNKIKKELKCMNEIITK